VEGCRFQRKNPLRMAALKKLRIFKYLMLKMAMHSRYRSSIKLHYFLRHHLIATCLQLHGEMLVPNPPNEPSGEMPSDGNHGTHLECQKKINKV
jgi:hypothetical protein